MCRSCLERSRVTDARREFPLNVTGAPSEFSRSLLAQLETIAADLAGVQDMEHLVETIESTLGSIVQPEYTGLYLLDPDTRNLRLYLAKGFSEVERAEAERTAMERHPGAVFRNGTIFHVPDVLNDPKHLTQSSLRSFTIRSRLYLPVRHRDRSVGTFGLASTEPNAFSNVHITILSFMCNLAAVVYSNILAARERESLRQQLIQSQKMEAVGRLAAGVAHDFNNVLTVILGHCDLVRTRHDLDADIARTIDSLRRSADHAAGLTRKLLSFSRQQVLRSESVDVDEVVRNVRRMLSSLISEDITIDTDFAKNTGHVFIDAAHLEAVLVNLAVNARDAMPDGGHLHLAASTTEVLADDQDPRSLSPGRYIRLSVVDSGSGMSPETLEQAFEPFFTTKPPEQGTGLGLPTALTIIRQASGDIRLESRSGRGTRADVFLPVHVEANGTPALGVECGPPLRGHETIMVVEDNAPLRELLRQVLVENGYRVLCTGNPLEAPTLARQHGTPIDIFLVDVVMPNMNGLELMDRLLKDHPQARGLHMSGYTDESHPVAQFKELNLPFLRKPFTIEEMLRRVRVSLESPSRTAASASVTA